MTFNNLLLCVLYLCFVCTSYVEEGKLCHHKKISYWCICICICICIFRVLPLGRRGLIGRNWLVVGSTLYLCLIVCFLYVFVYVFCVYFLRGEGQGGVSVGTGWFNFESPHCSNFWATITIVVTTDSSTLNAHSSY